MNLEKFDSYVETVDWFSRAFDCESMEDTSFFLLLPVLEKIRECMIGPREKLIPVHEAYFIPHTVCQIESDQPEPTGILDRELRLVDESCFCFRDTECGGGAKTAYMEKHMKYYALDKHIVSSMPFLYDRNCIYEPMDYGDYLDEITLDTLRDDPVMNCYQEDMEFSLFDPEDLENFSLTDLQSFTEKLERKNILDEEGNPYTMQTLKEHLSEMVDLVRYDSFYGIGVSYEEIQWLLETCWENPDHWNEDSLFFQTSYPLLFVWNRVRDSYEDLLDEKQRRFLDALRSSYGGDIAYYAPENYQGIWFWDGESRLHVIYLENMEASGGKDWVGFGMLLPYEMFLRLYVADRILEGLFYSDEAFRRECLGNRDFVRIIKRGGTGREE